MPDDSVGSQGLFQYFPAYTSADYRESFARLTIPATPLEDEHPELLVTYCAKCGLLNPLIRGIYWCRNCMEQWYADVESGRISGTAGKPIHSPRLDGDTPRT